MHTFQIVANDPEAAVAKISSVLKPFRLVVHDQNSAFQVSLRGTRMGDVGISTLSYGAEVTISPEPLEDFFLVSTPTKGTARIKSNGREVLSTPECASIQNPADDTHTRMYTGCERQIVRFNRSHLESRLNAMLGHAPEVPLQFNAAMDLSGGRSAIWRSALAFLQTLPPVAEPGLAFFHSQAADMLATALLLDQPSNYQANFLKAPQPSAPKFVLQAEEYMLSALNRPFSTTELAHLTGVSLRSLHESFQKYRGTTPLAFIKNARLERVRADLLAANTLDRQGLVTQIAMRWGFFHLGHFAADYQKKFHELPTQTLHAPR